MTEREKHPLNYYVDHEGEWRWTVRAINGRVTLASTQGYVELVDAQTNASTYLLLEPTADPLRWLAHTLG